MRNVATDVIEQRAKDAAAEGLSLIESCPYPFGSEAANHFCAIWYLHTDAQASINPRPKVI